MRLATPMWPFGHVVRLMAPRPHSCPYPSHLGRWESHRLAQGPHLPGSGPSRGRVRRLRAHSTALVFHRTPTRHLHVVPIAPPAHQTWFARRIALAWAQAKGGMLRALSGAKLAGMSPFADRLAVPAARASLTIVTRPPSEVSRPQPVSLCVVARVCRDTCVMAMRRGAGTARRVRLPGAPWAFGDGGIPRPSLAAHGGSALA